MFKNVLVGVDGTPAGQDAIALAARLTGPAGKLTLAHVHSDELHPLHAVIAGYVREEREASQRLLEAEREKARVEAQLISVTAISPGGGLHRQAEDQAADLLVVGSCRHGSFGRAMIGDDARDSLNGASCAVAIASRGYATHPAPITKIGVAYNGSPESKAALALAREIAASTGASIHALEVVSLPSVAYTGIVPPAIGESIDLLLEQAESRMAKLPGVQGEAVYGLVGEELAAFGEKVDILIAGSRGYGPVKRLVLGSTSSYLQHYARCPLLILPRSVTGQPDSTDTEQSLEGALHA